MGRQEPESMEKILIIEDDTNINNMIAEVLTREGYPCLQAFAGTEGLLYVRSEKPALVILDLMLPGMMGEELLPVIKDECEIPVIVLSAKDDLDSKIELLTTGADDYMTKPFEVQELLARVGVQLRKSKKQDTQRESYCFEDLCLVKERYSILAGEKEISLTKQEYKILELLFSNPNRLFSKQDIYDYAWDDLYIGEDKTVNVHISNIRKKLKTVSDREYIETVWGIGFKLVKANL